MRPWGNILITVAFILWIVPLGVFIKAADEKKVCGGQRAMCLCSHTTQGHKDAAKKIIVNYPSGTEKETSSSGGGENFLAAQFSNKCILSAFNFFFCTPNLYSFVIAKSVEHVPKAEPFLMADSIL